MKTKLGVEIKYLSPRMYQAWAIAEAIYLAEDSIFVITSGHEGEPGDGVHGGNSKHYLDSSGKGNAIDCRTRHLRQIVILRIFDKIIAKLPAGFDIVLEPTHIRIEWAPKPGEDV